LPAEAAISEVTSADGERVGEWFVASAVASDLRDQAAARVADHHSNAPADLGIPSAELARALRITTEQLESLLVPTTALVIDRGYVRHRSHAGDPGETDAARVLLAAIGETPLAPRPPDDLALARALVRTGALVELDGIYFTAEAVASARAMVIDALRLRGSITIADARDVLHSTRKYVVPLMTFMDREGVTRRRGDDRIPGPTSGLTDP
jgi:selenocysteine-specific elongation factor